VRIELDESIVKLGQRQAKERDAHDPLRNYLLSAVATLQNGDLTQPDAWENIIHDLECALATVHALAESVY
jgi:hypothetical protein